MLLLRLRLRLLLLLLNMQVGQTCGGERGLDGLKVSSLLRTVPPPAPWPQPDVVEPHTSHLRFKVSMSDRGALYRRKAAAGVRLGFSRMCECVGVCARVRACVRVRACTGEREEGGDQEAQAYYELAPPVSDLTTTRACPPGKATMTALMLSREPLCRHSSRSASVVTLISAALPRACARTKSDTSALLITSQMPSQARTRAYVEGGAGAGREGVGWGEVGRGET